MQTQETSDSEGRGHTPRRCVWRRPRATILGLLTFAWLSPRLSVLGVEFDTDLSKLPPARTELRLMLGVPRGALQVGLSPIEDPVAVAAFLSDSFPSLADIVNGWDEIDCTEDELDGNDKLRRLGGRTCVPRARGTRVAHGSEVCGDTRAGETVAGEEGGS
ncbi:hypothetical protein BN946_scf184740.g2 [Trametes cinnabarina]|uniref:Uncharacterized protein n=1 Tax=Pycnoporus cinnabarinus TaxID=5643 RepID=A0A060SVB0_PYCCI|nr:hypothetical protein BN946_scf184740.g2 [Trametes cinnabarina]